MKKIIALAFLALTLSAIDIDLTHEQAKPTTTAPTTATASIKPAAPATPAPVKIRQPHKEPGYEAAPGDPFGRDPQNHKTCLKAPCYDPVGPCTIATRPAPVAKTAAKATVNTGAKTAAGSTSTTTTTQTTAAARTTQGTWKPILYVVTVNGKRAKFAGFRCA